MRPESLLEEIMKILKEWQPNDSPSFISLSKNCVIYWRLPCCSQRWLFQEIETKESKGHKPMKSSTKLLYIIIIFPKIFVIQYPSSLSYMAVILTIPHYSSLWLSIPYYRRKFRSQTSENMDRWKADQGRGREKRKIRREKIREEKESEERRCRCAKR